jgi:hypothetical protein
MHADGQEHGSGLGSDIQDIADNGIFGDFDHGNLPPKLNIAYSIPQIAGSFNRKIQKRGHTAVCPLCVSICNQSV